jgi:hypothetical protein
MQSMYPITPTGLHAGYVFGSSKIITENSGRYGFPGTGPITVNLYDENAALASTYTASRGPVCLSLPPNYIGVLENRSSSTQRRHQTLDPPLGALHDYPTASPLGMLLGERLIF